MHQSTVFSLIWLIPYIINSQSIFQPTISNSSGDYFITQKNSDFNNGEIICNSDILCLIRCKYYNSCRGTTIKCNNATNCNIECAASSLASICPSSIIYISSSNTSITCDYNACPSITIYTDYTNHPSSVTQLSCTSNYACASIQIKDVLSSNNGYINTDTFKRACFRICVQRI